MHHKRRRNPPPADTADDPWEPTGLAPGETEQLLPLQRETCYLHRTRCGLCRRDIPGGTPWWRSLAPDPPVPWLCEQCGLSISLAHGHTTVADVIRRFTTGALRYATTRYLRGHPPLFPQ